MRPQKTLLLRRTEIAALLSLDECIAAIEQAFRLHAEGRTLPPEILSIPARGGEFHIKAAGLERERLYIAAKINGNFFQNSTRFGMPNIQGIILLCDGENGYPLALMDSMEITILRTGAATAVAARRLARPDSSAATICGCGNQGRVQLRALTRVLPLKRAYAFDTDESRARRFASELSEELGIEVHAVRELAAAVRRSDIVVTCTPARQFFLRREHVAPGMFVAAVGADSAEKQELDPALVASSKIVVDSLEQCARIGELHHALEKGVVTRTAVHGELGEVVVGQKPGRISPEEIILFDSTGIALEDVAAAAIVYEKAAHGGKGVAFDFAEC